MGQVKEFLPGIRHIKDQIRFYLALRARETGSVRRQCNKLIRIEVRKLRALKLEAIYGLMPHN